MNILSPSVLAIDFNNIQKNINIIDNAGAKYIHLDVMDGNFVPNISFGAPVIKAMRKITNRIFDVHLMIYEPKRYIKDFIDAGADIITVHAEACADIYETINLVKKEGIKVGVSINPETPVDEIIDLIPLVDMVLIMSVRPGFGGQKFIEETLLKATEIKKIIDELKLSVDIQMDGGITLLNVKKVLDAGVNIVVAGSAVFSGNIEKNVSDFLEILGEASE